MNALAYDAKLAWRAFTGVANFRGRSRRSEFGYYWIVLALLGLILWPVAELLLWQFGETLTWKQDRIVSKVAGLLFFLPIFALFVRRLHDQDRSGWWVMILPPLLAMNVYKSMRFIQLDPQTGAVTLPDLPSWLTLVGAALALAHLALMFWPGTDGPNRFGPDPREDDPRAPYLPSTDADLSSAP